MKINTSIILVIVTTSLSASALLSFFSKGKTKHHPRYELQTGDIVFQDTGGEQGEAIRAATKSPFTHCGVVFEEGGEFYVLEAVQPVSTTTLKNWKRRSTVFHARRLKNGAKLDAEVLKKARAWGEKQLDKDYDALFQWGDDELYCSELVWKIYKESMGLELCKPKTFQSYFLDDPVVRKVIIDRYGDIKKLPKDEAVVAPSDLATSELLMEVPRVAKK